METNSWFAISLTNKEITAKVKVLIFESGKDYTSYLNFNLQNIDETIAVHNAVEPLFTGTSFQYGCLSAITDTLLGPSEIPICSLLKH